MNSKYLYSVLVLGLVTLTAGQVWAGPRHHGYHDQARVLKVKPIYDRVSVPMTERSCRPGSRRVSHYSDNGTTETLVGGILGGVVGNQFGRGSGNVAMTVAGTLLGASIGNDMAGRGRYADYDPAPRCRTVTRYTEWDEVVGYRVKYRYEGRTHWIRTQEHPGEYIDVKVSVRPVDYR
jgi:uncharacterized protein YcfJ